MSIAQFELALTSDRMPFEKKIINQDQAEIILKKPILIENFSITAKYCFIRAFINDIIFEENEYFSKYIPRFIIKYIINTKFKSFKIYSENSFTVDLSTTSIKKQDNDPNSIRDNISLTTRVFINFAKEVKQTYEAYALNSKEWIDEILPSKKDSIYAYWNIPKNNTFIDMDFDEYCRRFGKSSRAYFDPYKILILFEGINQIKFMGMRPVTSESSEKKRFTTLVVTSTRDKDINAVLKNLHKKLFSDITSAVEKSREKKEKKKFEEEEEKVVEESAIGEPIVEASPNSSFWRP
jgi:ribosomal protein L12E/L44/L45/RPP1/RPP2